MTVADELPPLAVKFEKAIAQGRKPQSPVAIFEHRHHPGGELVREVNLIEGIMSERIRLSIEDLQPASGGMDHPERRSGPHRRTAPGVHETERAG